MNGGLGAEPRIGVSRINWASRANEAVVLADELLAELREPQDILGVQLAKLSALLNMNRLRECPAVLDAAWSIIQEYGARPVEVGEFHALAAFFAHPERSLQRSVT